MSNIVGIDVSLSNTGVYCGGNYLEIGHEIRVPGKRPGTTKASELRGATRLRNIYQKLCGFLFENDLCGGTAIIEGYAFTANARHHRLGEAGGVVRLACASVGLKAIYEVPPTALKKFFTGGGGATKEQMVAEAVRRHGGPLPSDDVADACALWHAGHDEEFLKLRAEEDVFTFGGDLV